MLTSRNRFYPNFLKGDESWGPRLVNGAIFLAGCGAGALSMYLLDPVRGARRRSYIRDKFVHAGRTVADRTDKQSRNLVNHVKGAIYEIRAKFRGEQPPDEVLIERVRAQLGHTVSHPAALEVRVNDGRVTVSGPVLSGERKKIEGRLHETRGVCDLALQVMEYESREGVQGLQGEPRRKHERRIVGI